MINQYIGVAPPTFQVVYVYLSENDYGVQSHPQDGSMIILRRWAKITNKSAEFGWIFYFSVARKKKKTRPTEPEPEPEPHHQK